MTKRKPNPQRGGRPRSGNERHTVSLPPDLWQFVAVQGGKNRSERLAVVVRRDAEHDNAAERVGEVLLNEARLKRELAVARSEIAEMEKMSAAEIDEWRGVAKDKVSE
jgi:hypothetical protein